MTFDDAFLSVLSYAYPILADLGLPGTMFAPTEDRDAKGEGFTHKGGDIVTISAPKLGALVNRVSLSNRIPRWEFGSRALMRSLSARGML